MSKLLETRVVVGLRQVDPVDLCAGIGLPRLEEAAEQEVVQVLVVEAQESQLDPGEFALGHVGLGRAQAKLTHLLPVSIRRAALPNAGNGQDLSPDIVLRAGHAGRHRHRRHRTKRDRALQHPATAEPRARHHLVEFDLQDSSSLWNMPAAVRPARLVSEASVSSDVDPCRVLVQSAGGTDVRGSPVPPVRQLARRSASQGRQALSSF
jgi:hypothetical protein